MQNTEKIKVLESILGDCKKSGSEYLFNCPKCNHHKPKFSVNIDKNCWKCWVCNYSGFKLYRLVRRYGNQQHRERWAEADELLDVSSFEVSFADLLSKPDDPSPKINLPDEFKTLATNNVTIDSLPARNYLKSRGLTKSDILKWKIGYCSSGDYENRVIFPSFNVNGDVNYFVGRSYDKNSWQAYKNPKISKDIVFNHLFIDWTSDVILVEGVFDAIVAGNAVPLLGSSLESDSKLFRTIVEHDSPVYIALDYDAEKKASKMIQTMLSYDIELFKIDTSGYDDVGSMSKDVFGRRKTSAKKIDVNNFLELKLTGYLA
jgi:DNA primase